MAVSSRDVADVQRWYPQIYLACHTRHQRRRSNTAQLTPHESSLLAHLAPDRPLRASALAGHLGVGRSTLSASIKRLISLGYITSARESHDGRALDLRLSARGARAMQAGSVLDTTRVRALLARLPEIDRRRALDGLRLLADAAADVPRQRGSTQ
jgi:DNA-binding MarR family transcriptional regulator